MTAVPLDPYGIRINLGIRKVSPCNGCSERTICPNCHDDCPKDARGEYGYKAWLAEIEQIKKEREKHQRLSTGKFKY